MAEAAVGPLHLALTVLSPPIPQYFNAPLPTSYDMPVSGSKDTPKTFKGKYSEVQQFVDHYEKLLNKCRITDESERCKQVLASCSVDVQNVIYMMEGYGAKNWARLKSEILRYFDAERATQKYKPADVERYSTKMRGTPCYSLTRWRQYFIRYNTIAGGCYRRGHLSRRDYHAYFLIGIHRPLRQILENRINQSNPFRPDEAQYTITELNAAAKWYFRRNRYESLMVHAADLGEEQMEDYSGDEPVLGSSSSDEGEDDFEEYLRKKKQRAKKKKQEKKEKLTSMKAGSERERQKFDGTEEEIANMIRKLNAMRIDDPEYAPVYFKVMVMEKTGTAKQCVKPPGIHQNDTASAPPSTTYSRPPYRPQASENKPTTSYPNNIPLGAASNERGGGGSECFGCQATGHRIFECPAVAELIGKDVVKFHEETRRLCMKNGDPIRRNYLGEPLVKAAERQAGQAPRVMFALAEATQDRMAAVHSFYQ
ncbi:hypothetical protein B0H16DRAFT_1750267 [Mycena metata]|uniref:CCHC-type domain-containing protein n=1 Tax=Mycena metata TaxID=1033252 RepID=A0AAD7DQ70_9AGAR|nr:hypothetical protein B0H16DRAFT_1750267 [Mycena metata]